MKVKIKVKYNTLQTLCDLYDDVCQHDAKYPSEIQFDRTYRAVKSVIDLLFIKLKKKLLGKQPSDKFNLNLEYHEAFHLQNFIARNDSFLPGLYEQNAMLQLITILDQKL